MALAKPTWDSVRPSGWPGEPSGGVADVSRFAFGLCGIGGPFSISKVLGRRDGGAGYGARLEGEPTQKPIHSHDRTCDRGTGEESCRRTAFTRPKMDEIQPSDILQAVGTRVAWRLTPDRGEEKRPGLERQVLPEVLPKPRIERRVWAEVDFENP